MASTFLPVLLTAAILCLHVLPFAATPLPFAADNDDPAHEIYGWGPMYPNTTLGGVIVEGPFPYKNGPVIWNDTVTSGAYGASQTHRISDINELNDSCYNMTS